MGASQSVDIENVDFEARAAYALWEYEDVLAAFKRLSDGAGGDLIKMMSLKRMDCWTVFTDYGVIRDGQWLTLPLNEFNRYDTEEKGSIYSFEVFAVLMLMCTADIRDKVEFCFTLFDFDHSNSISRDEMVMLQSTLLFAWSLSGFVVPGLGTLLTAMFGTIAFIYVSVAIAVLYAGFVVWRIFRNEAVPSDETGNFAPMSAQAPLPVELTLPAAEGAETEPR